MPSSGTAERTAASSDSWGSGVSAVSRRRLRRAHHLVGHGRTGTRRDGLGELGVHLLHDRAGVAGHAVGVLVVAPQFLGVDVNLDDALAAQPGGESEAGADGQYHVEVGFGLGHGIVAQTQRAQGQRVAVVDGALALGGGDDGSL